MKRFILVTILALLCFSCSKDDDSNEKIDVMYKQTFCADLWGYADNDSELATKISTFFEAKMIEISEVKFDTKGTEQVCLACTCFNGKRIIVQVNPMDLEAIKSYGFEEI